MPTHGPRTSLALSVLLLVGACSSAFALQGVVMPHAQPAPLTPAPTKQDTPKPEPTKPAPAKPEALKPETSKIDESKQSSPKRDRPAPPPLPPEDELIEAEARAADGDNPGETELVLSDRRRVSGRMVSTTPEVVTLAIAGVPTTFRMSEVEDIRRLDPVEERYQSLRAATRDDDPERLLQLAEWLRARGRYTLALREVSAALVADPSNRAALEARVILEQQQRIAHLSRWRAANPDAREPQPVEPPPLAPGRAVFPLLTDDQINILRVFETDLNDPPKMRIDRATVERFLDKYAGQQVEGRGTVPVGPDGRDLFLRQRPVEILRWFFDLRAREFYPLVKIDENPRALRLWRDDVHRTWLINSCATNRCHGGEEAGKLFLYNREPRADASALTNLFIIDQYRTREGLPLINYREPERSLLLQYGLPENQAVSRHPRVEGVTRRWQPAFDSPDDRRFRDAVQWIRSMYPNRTGYPIEYTPPVPGQLREVAPADSDDQAKPAPAPR